MTIKGLHHITLVTSDAQKNVDFYVDVLGLRFVKKTVNFDDPTAYHLYYGDETGSPGSAVTFFEWPSAPKGRPGIGGTHHFALSVKDYDALLKWKRRLVDLGIKVNGPLDRHYFKSIYFHDSDGQVVEIATEPPGFAIDEEITALGEAYRPPSADMVIRNRDQAAIAAITWPEPIPYITEDMALSRGMHHITSISSDISRTHDFFNGLLGIPRVKMTDNFDLPESAHWYWGTENGKPGTLITYFDWATFESRHRVQMGAGQTHHYAFAVEDEEAQMAWRETLIKAGLRVSPVMDRVYFKSIYTNDPDGHIVEIATNGPGFLIDEDINRLGQELQLPPWLEQHRQTIENSVRPITIPTWSAPEVV